MTIFKKFIRWTSKKSYKEASSDITSASRRMVIACLAGSSKPLTDREIAYELNFTDPNKVRPRRHELVKLGKVKEAGYKTCSITGKKALTWSLEV